MFTVEVSVVGTSSTIGRNGLIDPADFTRGLGIPSTEVVSTVSNTLFGTHCEGPVPEKRNDPDDESPNITHNDDSGECEPNYKTHGHDTNANVTRTLNDNTKLVGSLKHTEAECCLSNEPDLTIILRSTAINLFHGECTSLDDSPGSHCDPGSASKYCPMGNIVRATLLYIERSSVTGTKLLEKTDSKNGLSDREPYKHETPVGKCNDYTVYKKGNK